MISIQRQFSKKINFTHFGDKQQLRVSKKNYVMKSRLIKNSYTENHIDKNINKGEKKIQPTQIEKETTKTKDFI